MSTARAFLALMLLVATPAAFAETSKDQPTKADAAKATDSKTTENKADDSKAGGTKQKLTRAQIQAMLSKCSDEADAKGLSVTKGKAEARKAFRRECMRKLGVEPR